MKLHIQNNPYGMRVDLWIEGRGAGGQRTLAKAIKFEPFEDGYAFPKPSGSMDYQDAQELANALWSAGIRPEQSKQSQGAAEAQGRHLEDMRAIAFDRLKVAHPNR